MIVPPVVTLRCINYWCVNTLHSATGQPQESGERTWSLCPSSALTSCLSPFLLSAILHSSLNLRVTPLSCSPRSALPHSFILLCLLPLPSRFLCIRQHCPLFRPYVSQLLYCSPHKGFTGHAAKAEGLTRAGAMQGRKVAAAAHGRACCSTVSQTNDAARFEAAAISWCNCTLWSLQQCANVTGMKPLGWFHWTISAPFQKEDGGKRDPKNGIFIFIRLMEYCLIDMDIFLYYFVKGLDIFLCNWLLVRICSPPWAFLTVAQRASLLY